MKPVTTLLDLSLLVLHPVIVTRNWQRLAELVRTRREDELGMTQEEIAARGGPSTATLRIIEQAGQKAYRGGTLRNLEDALGWRRGSVQKILANGDPELVGGPPVVETPEMEWRLPPEAGKLTDTERRYVEDLIRLLAGG